MAARLRLCRFEQRRARWCRAAGRQHIGHPVGALHVTGGVGCDAREHVVSQARDVRKHPERTDGERRAEREERETCALVRPREGLQQRSNRRAACRVGQTLEGQEVEAQGRRGADEQQRQQEPEHASRACEESVPFFDGCLGEPPRPLHSIRDPKRQQECVEDSRDPAGDDGERPGIADIGRRAHHAAPGICFARDARGHEATLARRMGLGRSGGRSPEAAELVAGDEFDFGGPQIEQVVCRRVVDPVHAKFEHIAAWRQWRQWRR